MGREGGNNENKPLFELKKKNKPVTSMVVRPQLPIQANVFTDKISRWLTCLKGEKKAVRKFTSSLV